ncbi:MULTISPECIES: TRAP transporter large permease [Prauserella salsuginis group]|uniref:TRAP transporter large permease n=1 Tax=Prauserella salsuginis TaxID=387889 RepID=A0ABW6G142_9PSEU|nr:MULTISPECIES: TRAP transporter large permease [Prauserella salsuginis group]MCR3722047.1 TRAP transporter, DctM subunit [Prauserella flava]MCR3732628.1 TRAP transporter, DctM subunit [Prauserella salsuginis]
MSMVLLAAGIAVLLALRVPVAFALLGPCLTYVTFNGQSVGLSTRELTGAIDSFPLLAVPLFILLGVIANHAGIADRMFDFALALIGRVKGSLGYVNIGVSLGFSWMSGSALADAAGLGKVEVPAMVRKGYSKRFSVGITAASSLIGPVMPPSIPAVIYASIAAVSTGALFAASVLPAFLLATGLAIAVFVWARRQHDLQSQPFDWARLRRATARVLAPLLCPVIILGGILGGFFTPTEAAAVGAAYVLMLGLCYRAVRLRDLGGILRDTAATTASITLIIGASGLLAWILAREQVPEAVADWMLGFTDSQIVFLLMVNVLLIVLGAVLEGTSVLVITVPILLPIAAEFGVNPLHFGVLAIVNLMIGLLTPPIGAVLYVLSPVTKMPVHEVFRGTAPFLVPLVAVLLLLTFVPSVATFLPQVLGL